jgi:uncharacterized membrane protein YczE
MHKSISWPELIRQFLIIQIGFAIFGLSIALIIRGNLGTGAWSVLEVALANMTGITPGIWTVLIGFAILLTAVLLGEKTGWGTWGNLLCIGPWLDVFLWIIPPITNNLILQIIMLLAGIFLQGIASAIYINVGAGAGPRDSLMLAIQRTTGLSLRLARSMIEASIFVLGTILGGPAGWGTLIFTLLIGPSVQWSFRVFHVRSPNS